MPPTVSDDGEIPLFGVADGVDGNGLIEGHESAVVGGRERQQVRIGHLAMPQQPGMINQLLIEQGNRTRPVDMVFRGGGASQSDDRLRGQDGAGVAGVGSVDLTVTSVNCTDNVGVRGSMTPTRQFSRAPDCRPPARPSTIRQCYATAARSRAGQVPPPMDQSGETAKGGRSPLNIGKCLTFNVAS